MALVKFLKAIYTGQDVTALGEIAAGDTVVVPAGSQIEGVVPTGATGTGNLVFSSSLSTKQDTLVSGTSIKTINSNSLLGSGNITTGDVTTSGTQTLTNKTFTGYTETVYNLVGTEISSTNGTIQYKTLSGNTTFTEALMDGQCVTLMLNPNTSTVTWPTVTWIGNVASTAPTLIASVYNCITFFQFGGTLYGKYEGRV